jgi:Domain of unknown function (DUF4288)
MNWYLAKIVYRIIIGTDKTHQFEEQLRLIEANSPLAAFEKAYQIGSAETGANENSLQSLVSWKFVDVTELYRINRPTDGAEIFSSIKEMENGTVAEELMHKRAATVKTNIEQQLLDIY